MARKNIICERCGGMHPTSEHPEPILESGSTVETGDTMVSFETLKTAALSALEHAVQQDTRDTNVLILELDAAREKDDYDAQRPLKEILLQRRDVARMRGEEIPQKIVGALARSYASDAYSDMLQKELIRITPKDHPKVLVEALMDERFRDSDCLLQDLDDVVREQVYEELKENGTVDKLISLVSYTEDVSMQARLFEDLTKWLVQGDSKEIQKALSPDGSFSYLRKRVGYLLLTEAREDFGQFLERGLVELPGLADVLMKESDESLEDLLVHTRTIIDATVILKFMRSKESLLKAANAFEQVEVSEEVHRVIADRAQRLADAFENSPRISALGTLRKRTAEMDSWDVLNKFVVVLPDGEHQATIAWGNTKVFSLHKDLAKRTGTFPNELCSGGEIELLDLEDGRMQVVFKGQSGDLGPYSQAWLEQFKEAIAVRMEQEFRTTVEVVIQPSGM